MAFCRESSLNISRISLRLPNGKEKVIEIDPGVAYGRGDQPSTKLCIKELENIIKERKVDTVLDVGVGPGYLQFVP